MGCDIHLYVEVFNKETGEWQPDFSEFPNPEHDPNGEEWEQKRLPTLSQSRTPYAFAVGEPDIVYVYDDDGNETEIPWSEAHPGFKHVHNAYYRGRNYDLFAVLANVRNGYGFAGCDTGDGFNPISEPKGMPDDFMSMEIKHLAEEWGTDGHSHSWLTVAELDAYDWEQTTKQRGWVSELEYKGFKKHGRPYSWSGGVSGGKVVHCSNEHMDRIIKGAFSKEEGVIYYTEVEWEIKYSDSVQFWLKSVMPLLRALGEPDDVRIVFWFDN